MLNEHIIECPDSIGSAEAHNIHVYEWGDPSNDKVIVCAHALTRNGMDFEPFAKLVEDDYRVISADIAGRGKSDYLKNPEDYNYITYVADMLHVMQSLNISSCHWVGTSMGGLIGMMIAANVPGVITKLVMNDIGAELRSEGLSRIGEYVGNAPDFESIDDAKAYLAEVFAPWGMNEDQLDKMTANSFSREQGKYKINYDQAIGDPFKDDSGNPRKMQNVNLWEVWELVTCPTLLLRGEESDIFPKDIAVIMKTKPMVELIEYPEIGHAPSLFDKLQLQDLVNWIKS